MADLRIQHSELMVGANHPTLADTLNRLSLVEHNSDGTHNKLTKVTDPWVDVRAYGAVGDGTTDSNTGIQAALDSGKENILIPTGTFIFTGLSIPSTVRRIYGTGTLRLKNNAPGSGLVSVISASNFTGLKIEGIKVDLNKANNTIDPRILFQDITDLRVLNCTLINGYTVRAERCIDVWFEGNRSEGHDFYGLVCYGGRGIHVNSNELNNNGFAGFAVVGGGTSSRGGIWTSHSIGLTMSATSGSGVTCTAASAVFEATDVGCHIYSTGFDGKALITGYTSPTVVTVTIDNILSGTTTASFTLVQYAKDIEVAYNKCLQNTQFGINIDQYNEGVKVIGNSCNETTAGDGIIVQSGTFHATVAGNTCLRNYRDGIRINGDSLGSSTNVTGNTCDLNGTLGVQAGSGIMLNSVLEGNVTGNTCNDNYNCGIQLSSAYRGVCVGNNCSNRATTNQAYGIYQPTGGNMVIGLNNCFGNATNLSILKTAGAQNIWIGNRDNDSAGLGEVGIADVFLYRYGTGTLKTDSKLIAGAGLGVGNWAAASTPGSVTNKMQVFKADGTSLGYVAVYDAIT